MAPITELLSAYGRHVHVGSRRPHELGLGVFVLGRLEAIARQPKSQPNSVFRVLRVWLSVAAQGNPVDLGGYYHPGVAKASKAMRPSGTFNAIVEGIAVKVREEVEEEALV